MVDKQPPGKPGSGKEVGVTRPIMGLNLYGEEGNGTRGRDGDNGAKGFDGDNGPHIEIWTLKMTGKPAVYVPGQNGFKGGYGGDGWEGADGERGTAEVWGKKKHEVVNPFNGKKMILEDPFVTKLRGFGNGGNGGDGGNGGNGGRGGRGGNGGTFKVYAPSAVTQMFGSDQRVWTEAGQGGDGGEPGNGG